MQNNTYYILNTKIKKIKILNNKFSMPRENKYRVLINSLNMTIYPCLLSLYKDNICLCNNNTILSYNTSMALKLHLQVFIEYKYSYNQI